VGSQPVRGRRKARPAVKERVRMGPASRAAGEPLRLPKQPGHLSLALLLQAVGRIQ